MQACGYRDDKQLLAAKDVLVLGISGDSVYNQQLFKKAHRLDFKLLADIKGEVARKFGVPEGDGGSISKDIFGKTTVLTRGVTTSRWTFVIDKQGKIAYKDASVDVAKDSKNVLKAIGELKAK